MTEPTLAPHEVLEFHELLRNDLIALKKLEQLSHSVESDDLKGFVDKAIEERRKSLQEAQQFMTDYQHSRLRYGGF